MNTNNRNLHVIEAFRRQHGLVGGDFEGAPLLLLSTRGAKTNQIRTNPLIYLKDHERYLVFASKAGSPTDPDWFYNLIANPIVTIEVGSETFEATANVLQGTERDHWFQRQTELYPRFLDYQRKTTRKIPVIALSRN